MRPNIDISHRKNGRARDLADHFDLTTQGVYERIIDRGLSELEHEAFGDGESDVDWDWVEKECGFDEAELDAAQAVIHYVRGRGGQVLKSEVLEKVKPEHTARKHNDDNWWRKIVKPLDELGVVEKFHAGGIRVPKEE